METKEEWTDFLHTWSKAKITEDKTFDQIFNIDGIPLWWFYKPYLFLGMSPPHLPGLLAIKNQINTKKKILFYKYIYSHLGVLSFKKLISANERIKQIISRKTNNFKNTPRKKVLFLTYTNYIQGNSLENIARINKLLGKIKEDKKIDSLILVLNPISKLPSKNLTKLDNLI